MEIEKVTPEGYLIKVRLEKLTYTVFKDNVPEVPMGSRDNSIVCFIPQFVFVGEGFDIKHFSAGINYVKVEKGRVIVPYRHVLSKAPRRISVFIGSKSDMLPVKVVPLVNTREIIEFLEMAENKILVVDEEFPRFDLVQIKLKYPRLNVVVIKKRVQAGDLDEKKSVPAQAPAGKPAGRISGDVQVVDESKMRAADFGDKNINLMSKNPVFLSRVHLRNLELDKVKQILFDFSLTSDDCDFIESFLDTMIKKDSAELNKLLPKLNALKVAYREYPYVIRRDTEHMDEFLEQDLDKESASIIWMLILAQKEEAADKDDEILLWEWEERIKKYL